MMGELLSPSWRSPGLRKRAPVPLHYPLCSSVAIVEVKSFHSSPVSNRSPPWKANPRSVWSVSADPKMGKEVQRSSHRR